MNKKKIKFSGKLKSYMQWPIMMAVFLVFMNIVVYCVSVRAGLVVSGFIAFYVLIAMTLLFHYKPSIMNEMIYFATQYGQVQKQLLEEFEIPYALLDTQGKLIWMNREFGKITGKDKKYRKNIQNLFPSLDVSVLPRKKEANAVDITYNERDYHVQFRKISVEILDKSVDIIEIPEEQNYMIAMYLFDYTELNASIQKNKEQSMVAGLIYLDNYEEALDSVEEVRRSLLVALIDRKISKYISNLDGVVKKIEKDKYFITMKYKQLMEFQASRFSLLEEVKTVNIGNEMNVTLSIGIGVNGNGYVQTCEYARTAIEMALGRGGDQAVVKDQEKISYYGGKSQQMEKGTRVKARVKAHALREFIGTKEKVVIMGHKTTDIDALGASIGIYAAAKMLNKKAHIVLGEVNSSIRPWINTFLNNPDYEKNMFLNHAEAEAVVDQDTVLVVVDTNRPSMTECQSLLDKTKTIVVLDHHRQSNEVIKNAALSYIESYASSTCEMVAEILQYFSDGTKIKSREADCIYAGIIIDTNNFVAKTGVRTFEAAAFLRRNGADVSRVRKMLRNDMAAYKARAEAVRNAEVFMKCYAISTCVPTEDMESPTVVGAQAANELLNIIDIKASFALTPYQGKIFISARSIDEVNVQLIMERLGGGGHLNIAGAQLDNKTVEEAKKELQDTILKMSEEGAI